VDSDGFPQASGSEVEADLAHALEERVKELHCLFGISDLVEQSGGSLEFILTETVKLLPPSWNYSEVAAARIVLEGREYRSPSFRQTEWTQQADIVVHGKPMGLIEVVYLEARPTQDEGPFLREEKRLLHAVAERMGRIVERLTVERTLREREEEFQSRITHLTRVSTVGEMASSIVHEVAQPLTAVATYAQACRRLVDSGSATSEELAAVLEQISEETLRAGEIIHRLRSLVQKRPSKVSACDVNDLLSEVMPLVSVDARLNDITLHVEMEEELPTVEADGIQVQQVVLNLIRNGIDAMKEMPPERRRLDIFTSSNSPGEVVVSVKDRGCGLPEVSEGTLFEAFFTTKEQGMGMGLSICRTIVMAHGGRLWFSRDDDGGTTFSFTIPFSQGESE
jgi:two-component system sensor kinase FixL